VKGRGNLQVIGNVVSLTGDGHIEVNIPMKRCQSRLTAHKVIKQMEHNEEPVTMTNFLRVLNEHVEAYLRTAFQYPLSAQSIAKL